MDENRDRNTLKRDADATDKMVAGHCNNAIHAYPVAGPRASQGVKNKHQEKSAGRANSRECGTSKSISAMPGMASKSAIFLWLAVML